jgi:hypothetical protein
METVTVAHLKIILNFLPDDAEIIVNGGQGNKCGAWSAEPSEDKNGKPVLEVMY